MTSPSREQLIGRIRIRRIVVSICTAAFLADCSTEPPLLPPNNPANPQVRSSSKTPRNLLVPDQTTLAIEKELSATDADAKAAETMKHEMQSMPGMEHEGMKMEQHDQMKQGSEIGMQHGKEQPQEKKALENEMKKTSDEMKAGAQIYTCPLHPQVRSDKPGKCPICGMTLVPKKEGSHENH